MENCLHRFFLKLDFLSPNVQLKIKGKSSIQTSFGGIYSTIAVIVLLVFSWLFGNDVFYKLKPNLITVTTLSEYMPNRIMNFSSTFFAFRIEYNNATIIKKLNQSYSFTAYLYNYTKPLVKANNEQGNAYSTDELQISVQSCDFYRNTSFKNALIDYEFDNLLCLDPNVNFKLGGVWGSNLSIVEIIVDYCQNSTENNNFCLSKSEINANMNNFYFSIYYYDTVIDPTNFNSPFKPRISNIYTLIDGYIFKNAEFYYHSADIITDSGWFVESFSNSSDVQYHVMNTGVSTNNNDQSGLIQFDYYLNNYRNIYYRKYIKVQEVFAQLGGLIQILIILGNILLILIRDLKTNSYIMNQLFDFASIKLLTEEIENELLKKSERNKRISQIVESKKGVEFDKKSAYSKKKELSPVCANYDEKASFQNSPVKKDMCPKESDSIDMASIQVKVKNTIGEKEIKEIFKSMNKEKKFTYTLTEEFAVSYCCNSCRSNKNIIKYSFYKMIKGEVEKFLNIDYLAKKLHELEYIKYLLFSYDQIKCFHFFQKAEVCLDIRKAKKNFSKFSNESRNMDFEYFYSIIDYFGKIDKSEIIEGRSVNAKLFDLLVEEIQDIIIPK